MKKNINKNKLTIIVVLAIVVLAVIGIILATVFKSDNNDDVNIGTTNQPSNTQTNNGEKVDIIDVNSKTRPYAVVVNNTNVAVKVQEGLNNAYLVYEIPTEGNTSRVLALFKDVEDSLVIGTVRSARHNFVDFALESDAILCCYGWSIYAENDLKNGSIDYFQGLYGGPYYRNNPENLASEHTAYTSVSKLNDAVKSKGMRSTSNDSVLLNYNVSDVDLSKAENAKAANSVIIPYGSSYYKSSFKYDEKTKMYTRYQAGTKSVDHKTKEAVTTKNIIVQKLSYSMCDNNYYWDLDTIGSGEGYYITNGYAVPIKWSKSSRSAKTKYTYANGTIIDGQNVGGQEISVSDGRTWIEVQTTKQTTVIE